MMGKQGDLWDDSVLVNAFDHAISTYKKMHKGKNKDSSAGAEGEGETVIGISNEENRSNVESGNLDNARDAEEKSNIPATDVPDSDETSCVSKLEQNHHHVESQVDQTCLDSTNGQGIQSGQNSYVYAQGWDDYNQLLAQYNEIEEKRQKVWEQLNQYTGWNYQYAATASSSGVPYSNVPDHSMSAYQASDPNVVCTCCPCYSQCTLTSCTPVPACSVGELCVSKPCNHRSVEMDHKMLFPCEDGKIREVAIGAAERALSTIRMTMSGDASVNEEERRENSEPEQINGSQTDLTAVLNAWYSAGFYTGKYLAEQSIANRRQK